jgi:outer membrane protein assembly factor BamB
VLAFNLLTGQSAWSYEDVDLTTPTSSGRQRLGVPRYTLTVYDKKVYARMGSPITSNPNDQRFPTSQSYLVCLDLAREGSLAWDSRQSFPLDEKWAFEGSPICDGSSLYVALRRSDVHPQAHIACLDASTGKVRWQRLICSAESPAQGQMEEITHNLLCLHGGVVYYNTNLGAIAAVDGHDGQIQWIRRYPRAPGGDLSRRAAHFYRDLNPCVYYNDTIFAAPSDSPRILALEAGTGELRWETTLAEDTIHLLGVSGGNLIATGDKIWWFDIITGKPTRLPWPMDKPGGFGRGAIVDGKIYWPTRERVHVFDARTGDEARSPIELVNTHKAACGTLIIADGYFLSVTGDAIYGFETSPAPTSTEPDNVKRSPK